MQSQISHRRAFSFISSTPQLNRRAAAAAALALAASAALSGSALAQVNSAWTNTAGGVWSDPGNWSGGGVADGAGGIASFDILDVPTSGITVSLDTPRTIGSLIFGDSVPTTAGTWLLNDNGDSLNVLTLSGTPSIQVNAGATTDIALALAGTTGFTKTAGGTLILSGNSSLTGNAGVTNGALSLTGSLSASTISVS